MNERKIWDAIEPELYRMKKNGESIRSIVDYVEAEYDIITTANAMKKRLQRFAKGRLADRDTMQKKSNYSEIDESQSAMEIMDELASISKFNQEDIDASDHIEIKKFSDKTWHGICFTSDWHIGAEGCRYDRLKKDMDRLSNTENITKILVGDYVDNYIEMTPKGGKFEAIIRPSSQRKIAKHIIGMLKPDAILKGCHEDWSTQVDDNDFVSRWAKEFNIRYMRYGGVIRFAINGIEYKIALRHKFTGHSNINATNSFVRMYAKWNYDIGVQAHYHTPFIACDCLPGSDSMSWMTRCGSYKQGDPYGDKIGGYKGVVGNPFFAVNTETKEIKFLSFDISDGIRMLKMMNGCGI